MGYAGIEEWRRWVQRDSRKMSVLRCSVLATGRKADGNRMVDELWAHSLNFIGERHRLQDHLRGTAELARGFGEAFGAGDLAGYLGLVHDVGKGSCAWQKGLDVAERTGSRVGVDHKLAGAWLAVRAGAGPFAACVDGHHGGMRAAADLKNMLRAAPEEVVSGWRETVSRVTRVVPEAGRAGSGALIPQLLAAGRTAEPTARDMLARMLFSALVDADFLDTEAHFRGGRGLAGDADAGDLAARYEERRSELLACRRPSPADGWREEVYAQAIRVAAGPCGLYRMATPTGSGKTLSAGAFALHHAQANGLRRVVVAVPFISITEQNADVYRSMLDRPGHPVVLEHHSGAGLDDQQPGIWWRRLAAENWDAPFVVTTTVQLFQSLFDHRPAAMRKLHRLARSVIVLDEVQALPDRLLPPILSALRLLTERFGATVLLASATQPAYWSLEAFRGLQIRDVIPDPKPLYARLRRVRYQWRLSPRPTLDQVAGQAAAEPQVLVVVNTTADSALLHRQLEQRRDGSLGPCLHLSTRMAAGHRRDVLSEIRDRLAAGQPVAVVSTQLIEAGVDLDFPVVFRAWAPADSLQQAAGRCNRNGRLAEGRVVIFDPEDGGHPADSSYKAALHATASYFGPGVADPDALPALERYYNERYTRQNLDASGPGAKIQRLRAQLDFPGVAAAFQMIEEHTVPVAVEYGGQEARAEVRDLADRLRSPGPLQAGEARLLLRRLQPYLAALPESLARKAVAAGSAEPVIGDLVQWHGPYHPRRGIDPAALAGVQ